MPQRSTISRAMLVACAKSEDAPEVTLSAPSTASSAARPPMHTSIRARSCSREMLVSSRDGSCDDVTWQKEKGGKGKSGKWERGEGKESADRKYYYITNENIKKKIPHTCMTSPSALPRGTTVAL
jgi:hypothetical protein